MRDHSKLRGGAVGLGVLLFVTAVFAPFRLSTIAAAQVETSAQTASDNSDVGTESSPRDGHLRFYFAALGWFYSIVFLCLSVALVALIVMNLASIRRQSVTPPDLMQNFEALLNEKRYQEAYDLAKNDDSFLGRVLSAGLAKLQDGYAQAMEAMHEVAEDEHMRLKHRLSYIALIGTISPMVGLIGTVDGMVQSFQVFASSPTLSDLGELTQGISAALITTLVGLWLAIPAVAIFGIFRNRLARHVLEVDISSERLMSRFHNMGPKKPAAPAAQQV